MNWVRTLQGNAAWALALFSAVLGVVMLWVFGRFSNQDKIRGVKDLLKAHMLELRLFVDEPSLIWQAQKSLVSANLRYMGLMLRPFLILLVPMGLTIALLDPYYGVAPLPLDRPAIVAVQLNRALDAAAPSPVLQAPEGIVVETPVLRSSGSTVLSWRIRATRPVSGILKIGLAGVEVGKNIEAGDGPRYTPPRRVASWLEWLASPGEPLLPAGPVSAIEVNYPGAEVRWLGLELHWLIWFVIVSFAAALLLKSRMGVSF